MDPPPPLRVRAGHRLLCQLTPLIGSGFSAAPRCGGDPRDGQTLAGAATPTHPGRGGEGPPTRDTHPPTQTGFGPAEREGCSAAAAAGSPLRSRAQQVLAVTISLAFFFFFLPQTGASFPGHGHGTAPGRGGDRWPPAPAGRDGTGWDGMGAAQAISGQIYFIFLQAVIFLVAPSHISVFFI